MDAGKAVNILSLNLGSSSLKYAVHAVTDSGLECRLARNLVSSSQPQDAARATCEAITDAVQQAGVVSAVGHRVVFGGEDDAPTRITPELIERLEGLQSLDPLHAPGALAVIREALTALPAAAQIACFDTAFFRDLPKTGRTLPLPMDDPLLRRYGFHGLSYEHVCRVVGEKVRPRTAVAHLGNGASAAALLNGRPIATTMGFSPLGGMIMSTRTGDIDPGALLYLLERANMDKHTLRDLLENASGLRALSGDESDLRKLCERQDEGAQFAVEMFVRSAARAIAGLAIELVGLDMLIFTGGIGEHNAAVRNAILARLAFLNPNLTVEIIESDENASIAHNVARMVDSRMRTSK